MIATMLKAMAYIAYESTKRSQMFLRVFVPVCMLKSMMVAVSLFIFFVQ